MTRDPASAMPAVVGLERTSVGDDVFWTVRLADGSAVCVETHELQSNRRFLCACIDQLGRSFEPTPRKVWARAVDAALRGEKPTREHAKADSSQPNNNEEGAS